MGSAALAVHQGVPQGPLHQLAVERKLNGYLADIDQQAQERLDTIIRQMAEAQGITEALKAADPMAWVGQMNYIQSVATEIVNAEVIFT